MSGAFNATAAKQRLEEIGEQAQASLAAFNSGDISRKQFASFVNRAEAEADQLRQSMKAHDHANQIMAGNELAGGASGFAPQTKGMPRPQTPMSLTGAQVKSMWQAMKAKTPFTVEIGQPTGLENVWAGVHTKAAGAPALEGNITGGFSGNLPPVQTMYAVGLGYETTRIADLLPGAQMPGPSATWLSHTANTNEATGAAEGASKTKLGPTTKENQVKPQKLAAIVETSLEAWQDTNDYGEAQFASWLPQEATRSLVNAESLWLLQATTGSSNSISGGPVDATFNGLLNTSGTLTRAVGSDTNLDAMSKAFNDVRVGSAFAWPDLVVVHPTTWNSLRLEKDGQGRYVMDLLSGPLGLTADGQPAVTTPANTLNSHSVIPQGSPAIAGNLWGVPVALTTQCPAGTALVMSVRAGAGIFWQRLGMLLEFNMFATDYWEKNQFGWRVEERIALSVPRPSAINIVTGLPTS